VVDGQVRVSRGHAPQRFDNDVFGGIDQLLHVANLRAWFAAVKGNRMMQPDDHHE
jgi:hypothetical protein